MNLQTLLQKQLLFLDGAMGTMLQSAGLPAGEAPDLWNLTHPEEVEAVHAAYLAAGSDILTTNTFGCTAHKLAPTGYCAAEVAAAGSAQRKGSHRKGGRETAFCGV